MKKVKKFRLFDAVLASVCVILTIESAAPAAAVGNAQYFWWIMMLFLFFMPYGMISAELGTTYLEEGGLYGWVRLAFGNKWASRVAWNYWINFSLWVTSLAVLFNDTLLSLIPLKLGTAGQTMLELFFIWMIVFFNTKKINDSKWILNIAAVFKVVIMLLVGGIGVYYAMVHGPAVNFTVRSLFPEMDFYSLSFVSIIIYNFVGFEIVTTLASEMDRPKKQIPQALLLGGIFIAFFYMFASFGIGVAIPADELSASSGLLDSISLMIGNGWIITIVGFMMLFTFVANLVSWAYGSTYVAKFAAQQGDMPAIFAKTNRNGVVITTPVINGIIASVMVMIVPYFPNQDIFWSFFSVGVITLMLSYIPMFPAFLKLRRVDPDRERPFKMKGGRIRLTIFSIIPMLLIIASLIFIMVPMNFSKEELTAKLPLLLGTLLSLVIQEIIVWTGDAKRRKKEGTVQQQGGSV